MKLLRNEFLLFFKDSSFLVFGTILAQIIIVFLQPYLKHLYSPEIFGVFEIYFRILSVLVILYSFSLEISFVLSKDDELNDIIRILFVIPIIMSLITIVIWFLWGENILNYFDISISFYKIFYLLPVSALLFNLYKSIDYFLLRKKEYKILGINKIFRRSSEGIVQISFSGIWNQGGLFFGDLVGNFVYFISSFIKLRKYISNIFQPKFKSIFIVLKKYSYIIKYNFIPNLLNVLALSSLSFIALQKFSVKDVGYLELSQKMLLLPSALIGMTAGKVVLQRVAEYKRENKSILNFVFFVTIILLLVSLFFYLILQFFGDFIFDVFFSKEWLQSLTFSKYLIYYIMFYLVFSPLGQVLMALDKIKINSIWQIIKFGVIYSIVLFDFDKITDFLFVYSGILTTMYIVYGVLIYKSILKYENELEKA